MRPCNFYVGHFALRVPRLPHDSAPNPKGATMDDAPPTSRASGLRAHAFLVFVLCLLGANLAVLVAFGDYGLDQYGNLAVTLGLLFQHLAIRYARVGWQRSATQTLSFAWLAFMLAYLTWLFWLMAR